MKIMATLRKLRLSSREMKDFRSFWSHSFSRWIKTTEPPALSVFIVFGMPLLCHCVVGVAFYTFCLVRLSSERPQTNGFTWNSSVTLILFLADVSMNDTPHAAASALPSNSLTSRKAALSSHLLPTNMTGICDISAPFSSLISDQIDRNSSKLCFEHTEYTKMNAWPFVIDNRCIAGNWWLPVVSVICKVQMFLLQLMTWKNGKLKRKKEMERKIAPLLVYCLPIFLVGNAGFDTGLYVMYLIFPIYNKFDRLTRNIFAVVHDISTCIICRCNVSTLRVALMCLIGHKLLHYCRLNRDSQENSIYAMKFRVIARYSLNAR